MIDGLLTKEDMEELHELREKLMTMEIEERKEVLENLIKKRNAEIERINRYKKNLEDFYIWYYIEA